MPGIASIRLLHRPLAYYPPHVIEELEAELDAVFSQRLERKWECYLCQTDPSMTELVARLDQILRDTNVGPYPAGQVVPDPTQIIDQQRWDWSGSIHTYSRLLFLGGIPFTQTVSLDGTTYEARVLALYGWATATPLPGASP